MTFDWSEYLKLGQELAGKHRITANQEAKLRSSVSRAYYAVFCKARNYLRDIERSPLPEGPEVHKYVETKFKEHPDKVRRKIGSDLDRLRIDRNKVDYDDIVAGLSEMTALSLKRAEDAISIIDTF